MRALVVIALLCAGATALAEPLKRKSGLWEVVMASDRDPALRLHECVDRASDDLTKPEEGASCSRFEIRRQGAGWAGESVCKENGSVAATRFTITGNFDSAYKMESRTTLTPPLNGVAQFTLKIEGRWIAAACKPGQKPGDTDLVEGAPPRR